MADETPRVLNPYMAFTGPQAGPGKNFSMNVQTVSHRHPSASPDAPAVELPEQPAEEPETVVEPEAISPDAEPIPTPLTPTPRPDGQPPAPDAVTPLATVHPMPTPGSTSGAAGAVVVSTTEAGGSYTS